MDIVLLDGRTVNGDNIAFHPDTYHFTLNAEDVTDQIRRSDKHALVPNFDDDIENTRVFTENYTAAHGQPPNPIGSTSTAVNFFNQIATNPLGAPIDALTAGFKTTEGKTLIWGAVALLAVVLLLRRP